VEPVEILYEDAHLIAVVKPAGVPVQPDKTGDADLQTAVSRQLRGAFCGVVHRLDRTVGGVTVFAKTKESAAKLSAAFADGRTEKRYEAVVTGALPPSGTLMDYLVKNERLNVSRVVSPNAPHAKKAMLSYETVGAVETADGQLTRLRILLGTGRHHQIRVQLAHAGAPLWGDTKYNPAFARKRDVCVALWAETLSFAHPVTGKRLVVSCPPHGVPPWGLFGEFEIVLI